VGQGLLGLLLDARYGLLPYVPLLLLAFAGLVLKGDAAARLRRALPVVLGYYVTVASADNWSGAVCNLGRYIMPLVPWLAALLAITLAATAGRRGVLALALMAAGWSALLARALWLDPHAANDCALLLAKAAIADGNVYLPNLFIRAWSDGAPGLLPRVALWIALATGLAVWLRRVAMRGGGDSSGRTLAAVFAVALAAGLVLERWPSSRRAARFPDALTADPETVVFVTGGARVEEGVAVAGSGDVELLVRSRRPLASLRVVLEGDGVVRVPGHAPVTLRGRAVEVDVPLAPLRRLTGRRGVEETLSRQTIAVDTDGGEGVRLRPATSSAAAS
jgi:hypothetical protein